MSHSLRNNFYVSAKFECILCKNVHAHCTSRGGPLTEEDEENFLVKIPNFFIHCGPHSALPKCLWYGKDDPKIMPGITFQQQRIEPAMWRNSAILEKDIVAQRG